jgi:Cytosine/adenosine deaminases
LKDKETMTKEELMRRAIELSENSVRNGGGPFGAVIAKDGEIIAEGSNKVTINNDPTAHAEVCAIRNACKILNTFELANCVIYTSCEPCPMCLGAIYWARLSKIFYANDRKDAAEIGFDDDFIYEEIAIEPQYRKKPSEILLRNEAINAFRMWTLKDDKTKY